MILDRFFLERFEHALQKFLVTDWCPPQHHQQKESDMRANTLNVSNDPAKEKEHNVSPIQNEESERIRLSELRGESAKDADRNPKSYDARQRANGENDPETGATRTGFLLSRNPSRIAVKKELVPILQGAGTDAPLSDPKQLGPAHLAVKGHEHHGYARTSDKLGTYKQNEDKNQPSVAPSRKPKSVE